MIPAPLNSAAAESLLAFWRDAGVDACYEDAPVDRTHVEPPPAVQAVTRATASVASAEPVGDAVSAARRLAASADTLQALDGAVAAFEGCALRGLGSRQSVFGRGQPSADLLVIGEAPGAEDDVEGRPFAGRVGRLLDRMLAEAGLGERAFLTNTVFWRPPGDRPPTAAEQTVCAPFLERAFALIRPRAVLLLGGVAAKSVLSTDDSVMRLRGNWRDWRLAEGGLSAPAMSTLHPAFLLRTPMAKKTVWSDLLEVATKLDAED